MFILWILIPNFVRKSYRTLTMVRGITEEFKQRLFH